MSIMIAVDVEGTFTDFSTFDTETGQLKHFKHSSTPEDPSKAIVSGILHVLSEDVIGPEQVSYLAHGTTVATNALIEKKGARLGLTRPSHKNLRSSSKRSEFKRVESICALMDVFEW